MIPKLAIYTADMGETVLAITPDGEVFIELNKGWEFERVEDGLAIAAIIRAAPIMLEALETAVDAHDKALELTLSQIADSGNMVEYIGFPEWYEKAKAAIEAAKNTYETL